MIGKHGVKINTKAEVRGEDQPPNPQTCSIYESTSHLGFFLTAFIWNSDSAEKAGQTFVRVFAKTHGGSVRFWLQVAVVYNFVGYLRCFHSEHSWYITVHTEFKRYELNLIMLWIWWQWQYIKRTIGKILDCILKINTYSFVFACMTSASCCCKCKDE